MLRRTRCISLCRLFGRLIRASLRIIVMGAGAEPPLYATSSVIGITSRIYGTVSRASPSCYGKYNTCSERVAFGETYYMLGPLGPS